MGDTICPLSTQEVEAEDWVQALSELFQKCKKSKK